MTNQPRRHQRGQTCPDCGHIHQKCLSHTKHTLPERAEAAEAKWGHGPPWPCGKHPVPGAEVCNTHGGDAPHVRAAAERRVAEAEAAKVLRRRLGDTSDATPVTNPAVALARLAGDLQAWYGESKALVAELAQVTGGDEWEGTSGLVGDDGDIHPMVKLHERAQERLAKVLADMERIGIAHHLADIEEAKAAALFAAVVRALQSAGVDSPEVRQAIAVEVRALEPGDAA
jgi:hypothetical protein